MGDQASLTVSLTGSEAVQRKLAEKAGQVDEVMKKTVWETEVSIRSRAVDSFDNAGGPPNPPPGPLVRRSGRLSRAIQSMEPESAGGHAWFGRVGVLATVPYGRIHEFGFDGEERVTGHTRSSSESRRSRRYHPWGRGGASTFVGTFIRRMHMPARPYMAPAFEAEQPLVQPRFRERLAALLGNG